MPTCSQRAETQNQQQYDDERTRSVTHLNSPAAFESNEINQNTRMFINPKSHYFQQWEIKGSSPS
jgi:hypothetical protein